LLNRVILALALERSRDEASAGLTSGDIQRFYGQLSMPLDQPSISKLLSGKGKAYFMADGMRVKGAILRYRLSRTGLHKAAELGIITES